MKNLAFTCCLLLFSFVAQAEYLIKGKVTDLNDQPIPYVTIGFVGTSIGTIATAAGDFELYLDELPEATPLRFSCMGYEAQDLILSLEKIGEPLQIKLNESTLLLQEQVVKPKVLKTIEYGNADEKTAIQTNLAISTKPNMNLGAEIGRKFRLGKEANYLSKLKFFVAFNNFDTLLIRVNFYELESGKPTKIIQQKPILRQVVDHQSGWVTVDLEEENLMASGTIVASIEWIGASKRGNKFGLNISMPALFQTHYYKYGAQNNWKVYPNMSSSMVLVVESEETLKEE
jgi:hypothetical protein